MDHYYRWRAKQLRLGMALPWSMGRIHVPTDNQAPEKVEDIEPEAEEVEEVEEAAGTYVQLPLPLLQAYGDCRRLAEEGED